MTDVLTPRQANKMRLGALALLPAPVIALLVLLAVAGTPLALPVVIGAAGWLAALVLRQPVALLASRRLSKEGTAKLVGWFSGPAEELVRLALVLLTVHTVEEAAWLGWGWATIEVLIIGVNVLALASLLGKDDEKSREARELLAAQGMLKDQNPVWSFVERLSASAMHIGFTLLLFVQPWLVLVTLPVHSVTNMLAAKYGKKHLALTELGLGLVAVATVVATVLVIQ